MHAQHLVQMMYELAAAVLWNDHKFKLMQKNR